MHVHTTAGRELALWAQVVQRARLSQSADALRCVPDFEAAHSRVRDGACDVILSAEVQAPLMTHLQFTAPVFTGGVRVLQLADTSPRAASTFSALLHATWEFAQLFDWKLLAAVLATSTLAAGGIWLFEGPNANSPLAESSCVGGLLEVWWLCIPLGAGALSGNIRSYLGRAVSLAWNLSSSVLLVIFSASFTARLIALTLSADSLPAANSPTPQLSASMSPGLSGAQVGVFAGDSTHSAVMDFLQATVRRPARVFAVDQTQAAARELHRGSIEALLVRSPTSESLLQDDCALDSPWLPLPGTSQVLKICSI